MTSVKDPTSPVRPLRPGDLQALMGIQLACYGAAYAESAQVYARRLAHPQHCSLAVEQNGTLLAYLAAYWSEAGKVTPLHGDFEVCAAPGVLYLHDMAVHPAHAGQGLASRLLAALWPQARQRGIFTSCLVSVQGTQDYWRRHGYLPQPLSDPQQLQRLSGYGKHAGYMQRMDSGDNAGYA